MRGELLDEDAPKTCDIVWNALPMRATSTTRSTRRTRSTRSFRRSEAQEPGGENITIVPAAGDVCYFYFPIGEIGYRWARDKGFADIPAVVDLADLLRPQ